MERITLLDISKAAGVSIGTVERAINNRKGINTNLKKEILKIAEEMGYEKNILASSLSKKEKKKILIFYPKEPSFYWDLFESGLHISINEYREYSLNFEIVYTEGIWKESYDVIEQKLVEIIEEKKCYDLIALIGTRNDSIIQKIETLAKMNIKIVTFNEIFYSKIALYHLGADNLRAGRIAAELLCKFMGGIGNVIIISNGLFDSSLYHYERMQAFNDYISLMYPSVNIIGKFSFNYKDSSEGNKKFMEDMFKASHDLRGIYDFDGASLASIGNIIFELNQAKKIILVGHEISDEVKQLLKEGIVYSVISDEPYNQGKLLIKSICDYYFYGKIPKDNFYETDTKIIIRESIL